MENGTKKLQADLMVVTELLDTSQAAKAKALQLDILEKVLVLSTLQEEMEQFAQIYIQIKQLTQEMEDLERLAFLV